MDVFFFVSGFLGAYLMVQKMYPREGRINVLMLYFHRFYRLVPAILALTLIALFLFIHFGGGPIFYASARTGVVEPCEKYWWSNFLFIQNLYPGNKGQCQGQCGTSPTTCSSSS